MEKLTEAEMAILDNLDDTTREMYDDALEDMRLGFTGERRHAAMIVDVITKLARALTPLPGCGHPAGSVRSVPYIDGVAASSSCAWCAAEAKLERMEYEHAVWEKHGLTQIVEERNALNTRLVECMQTRSTTKVALKAERDALREKLAAAEACGYALMSLMNWWDALSAEVPKVRRRDNWTAIMERYDALVRVQLKQAIDDWRETH